MKVATFEGIVENGQIKLPEDVHVPERTRVYVVIPGVGQPSIAGWTSPRRHTPNRPGISRRLSFPMPTHLVADALAGQNVKINCPVLLSHDNGISFQP